ncbi:lipocalin family protein [Microscilla marina]|uniref:Outer membrane autotransporter barrel domain protein, putative n=1 Tax=Microscilla marina ATCC 23134 TaxID=313606 RepID=A1ZLP2_MICM2|nr:lipocalin family protein [Microscilla marina]EAY28796.1 outer membrane autotransporter barrel domain protein, putative [Microscilla marina ATCC 23134]
MKKNYFSLLLMTLVCVFAFTACKKGGDNDPGTTDLLVAKQPWTVSKVTDQNNTEVTTFQGKTVTFSSDGSYTHTLGSATESGTYTVTGSTITFTPASGTAYASSFSDVNATSTELTFKMTVESTKTGTTTYSVTMQ